MNIVEIRDFCFAYPDCSSKVLDQVNLSIQEGTLNVICGRSGCGKSTLLRHLKSVLMPHGTASGEILYKGKRLREIDHRTQSQEIGFVMQNPNNQIVTDKVWHELSFGLESLGYDNAAIRLRVAEMASYFGIHQWFYKGVEELSIPDFLRIADGILRPAKLHPPEVLSRPALRRRKIQTERKIVFRIMRRPIRSSKCNRMASLPCLDHSTISANASGFEVAIARKYPLS